MRYELQKWMGSHFWKTVDTVVATSLRCARRHFKAKVPADQQCWFRILYKTHKLGK